MCQVEGVTVAYFTAESSGGNKNHCRVSLNWPSAYRE